MNDNYIRLPRDSTEVEEDARLLGESDDDSPPLPRDPPGFLVRLRHFFLSATFLRICAFIFIMNSSIMLTIGFSVARNSVVGPILPWITFSLALGALGLDLHCSRTHPPSVCSHCHNPLSRSHSDLKALLVVLDFAVVVLLIISSSVSLATLRYPGRESQISGGVLGIIAAIIHITIPFYFMYGTERSSERTPENISNMTATQAGRTRGEANVGDA